MSGSFLLGLIVGTVVFGGQSKEQQEQQKHLLEQIPIRCLGLLESDVAQYRECRKPSMKKEIWDNYKYYPTTSCRHWTEYRSECAVREHIDKNLDWEIKSLQQLVDTAKTQQK